MEYLESNNFTSALDSAVDEYDRLSDALGAVRGKTRDMNNVSRLPFPILPTLTKEQSKTSEMMSHARTEGNKLHVLADGLAYWAERNDQADRILAFVAQAETQAWWCPIASCSTVTPFSRLASGSSPNPLATTLRWTYRPATAMSPGACYFRNARAMRWTASPRTTTHDESGSGAAPLTQRARGSTRASQLTVLSCDKCGGAGVVTTENGEHFCPLSEPLFQRVHKTELCERRLPRLKASAAASGLIQLGNPKMSPLPMPEHNVVLFKAQTIATVIKQLRGTHTATIWLPLPQMLVLRPPPQELHLMGTAYVLAATAPRPSPLSGPPVIRR